MSAVSNDKLKKKGFIIYFKVTALIVAEKKKSTNFVCRKIKPRLTIGRLNIFLLSETSLGGNGGL